MANEMVVLQGQSFSIELQSMLGSTNYGWTLTKLPQGIALLSTETAPTAAGITPVVQRFWFGAVSATEDKAELEFTLVNLSDISATKKTHTVLVNVIPSDSDEFAKFSENSDATIRAVSSPAMPYGLVLGTAEAALKYGYPCGVNDVALKYGYPCGVNDIALKYGYPCGTQEAALKYGYPCGVNDVALKYGYPCGAQDAALNREAAMIYGFKSSANEAALKYGYPCGVNDVALKYGYPCGAQDAATKNDVAIIYGFKCDSQKSDC